MARTITLTPQTSAQTNTKAGTTIFDIRYNPTLTTTWTAGSDVSYAEGTASGVFTDSTTAQTFYIPTITDTLVTKYGT